LIDFFLSRGQIEPAGDGVFDHLHSVAFQVNSWLIDFFSLEVRFNLQEVVFGHLHSVAYQVNSWLIAFFSSRGQIEPPVGGLWPSALRRLSG
jgi:hypothetical protein